MRRGIFRKKKRAIFVACEGDSELGYVRWLSNLAESQHVFITFNGEDMKGGSAKDVVRNAIKFLEKGPARNKHYHKKLLLLDRNLAANAQHDLREAQLIAKQHAFDIIWQHLCHECFLLKHFPATANRNPSTAQDCVRALRRVWPDYRKPMDATNYERVLLPDNLACARHNLPGLDGFLNGIGWR